MLLYSVVKSGGFADVGEKNFRPTMKNTSRAAFDKTIDKRIKYV